LGRLITVSPTQPFRFVSYQTLLEKTTVNFLLLSQTFVPEDHQQCSGTSVRLTAVNNVSLLFARHSRTALTEDTLPCLQDGAKESQHEFGRHLRYEIYIPSGK